MGAYLILQKVNLPLQIQPQIFGFFSLISWSQVLYYGQYVLSSSYLVLGFMLKIHRYSNYSALKATAVCLGTAVLFGGLEALLILTLRVCIDTVQDGLV